MSVSQLGQSLLHSIAVLLSTFQLCLLLITPQLQTGTLARGNANRTSFKRFSASDGQCFSHVYGILTLVLSYFSMSWSLATCSFISFSCSYKRRVYLSPPPDLKAPINFYTLHIFTHSDSVLLHFVLLLVSPQGGAVRKLIHRVVFGISKQIRVCSGPERQGN